MTKSYCWISLAVSFVWHERSIVLVLEDKDPKLLFHIFKTDSGPIILISSVQTFFHKGSSISETQCLA
ncbi:MAG TPA: hypothetical protein DER04_02390 [Holosporales bacterium]|nr:hypothetical protein [Holosporales bacterium]